MNKFCFISSSLTRWDPRIVQRQAKSLVKFGFEVTYIVCDLEPDKCIDGITIISSGFLPTNRYQRFFSSKSALLRKALSIDAAIYQVSEPELIPVGLKLKKSGKKVIFDMREDYPQLILSKEYIPSFFRKPISFALKKYMKRCLKKYDLLFSVTPHLVDELKIISENAFLVTNYPVVGEADPISFNDYSSRVNTLCYIGSVYRISRQEIMFNALNDIENIRYIIAGRIEDRYKSELKILPYWEKVEFIDGISLSEIQNLYKNVTIGNALRDFSDSGYIAGSLGVIKFFEYMEASLPVICTDVKLWKGIIDKYQCGICVDANNENEIAIALKYLVDHKTEAYLMGQNARRAVIEEFNWGSQEVQYLNAINMLLA